MRISRFIRFVPAIFAMALIAACGDPAAPEGIKTDDDIPVPPPDPTPASYVIPDYADDYSSISAWSNHNSWNLANVHDPSIAYYNGYYYMYGTDASYGNEHEKATTGKHFQGKRSKDLVNWTYLPGPMNSAPTWVKDSLNAIRTRMNLPEIANPSYGYWAPVVRKVKVGGVDKLRMYYCIVVNNNIKKGGTSFDGSWTERAFIGMCESTDPANAIWEDKGFVTCSSSDKGRDGWARPNENDWNAYFYYNAIDPTYIVTPEGKHYLIHGSWHSGFALLQIDPESGKPVNAPLGDPWADNSEDLVGRYGIRVGTRTASSRWQGSEAPEIIYKDGYYYLFMAYDGLDVPYNTRVVRSRNIEGPYTDITGRNFTNGRGDCYPIVTHPYKFKTGYGWVGLSHCAIFQQEGTGDWFYCSQGRLPAGAGGNAYSNAIMMGHVRRIVWCPASVSDPNDLWPIALPERYAGLPAGESIKKSELVGKWEHINLKYDYANQDKAEDLILNADGTMSGALTGKWSFDESKKQLTLGDVIVCVEREADWEASPRVATLVYAGTEKTINATYWGKKVK
ncbi:MAG: arabinan endo-1,5-alpha-L-arabinosidase [Bacteroidales bacterium]|nr:arabinan endo-1,5-alpha-L-arabinosidase [Bacteroidales bacterium]